MQILAYLFFAYFIVGIIVFFFFTLTGGLERVDPTTKGATFGFRLIILPAVCGLWPLLLNRWLKAKES